MTIQHREKNFESEAIIERTGTCDVSVVEINLSNIDHNVGVIRSVIGPDCDLCPIVKADAYGLGAVRVAKQLVQNDVQLLAVYTPQQAAELLGSVLGCRVLVLMPVYEMTRSDELYRGLVSGRLQLTVHDLAHLGAIKSIAEQYGVVIGVHLEVDTGMSRGGCPLREADLVLDEIASCRRLRLDGLFTHFASPDGNEKFTNKQFQAFEKLLDEHDTVIDSACQIHVASTFAIFRRKEFHKTMVRVGLAWMGYGYEWMEEGDFLNAAEKLRPIVSWKSRIVQMKTIERGTPVGYESTWTAKRKSVIGLVPVGYADGYPIGVGATGRKTRFAKVGVLSERMDVKNPLGFAPVVGAVNMDQITVDLTDIVSRSQDIGVGTIVELISPELDAPNRLSRLGDLAKTIPHEMLCRLNPRMKRLYVSRRPLLPKKPAKSRNLVATRS